MAELDNSDGFLFSLGFTPKDYDGEKDANWVTDLLKLKPTGGHKVGDTWGQSNQRTFKYWRWEYTSPWITYYPSETEKSFSDYLLEFLRLLPSDKSVWDILNVHCDYSLYIPVEREYSIIEVEFDVSVLQELAKRKLEIRLSTLSREESVS